MCCQSQDGFVAMLFKVEMDVRMSTRFPAEADVTLKQAERARAQDLQRAGVWRICGEWRGAMPNVSIFDVSGPQDLHDILSSLPLFPFMDIRITPLCRHPSSIRDDDR